MKPPKFKTSWRVTHIISTIGSDGLTQHHLVSRGRMIGRSKYDPREEDEKRKSSREQRIDGESGQPRGDG